MAVISQCNIVVDLASELTAITTPWIGAYCKEDGRFYFRNATAWVANLPFIVSAAGTVASITQPTSKATGVTLNKASGDITLNAASLAAGAIVSFTLTNSLILATDLISVQHQAGVTFGAYLVSGRCAAGSAVITVRNVTAGALAQSIVLRFSIDKGVVS